MKNFIKKNSLKRCFLGLIFIFALIFSAYGGYLKNFNQRILPLRDKERIKLNGSFFVLKPPPDSIKAAAYLVGVLDSGQILISKNQDLHLFPASLSKLMTAVIALDNFSLDQQIYISPYAESAEGNGGNLEAGEYLYVKDLLKVLLITSSNDAAVAFGETLDKKGKNFVDGMNIKAKQLNMFNTAFFGVTGLDRNGNFSTVGDLFKLTQEIRKNYPLLGEITAKPDDVVWSADGRLKHELKNTNILAGQLPYLWLGKTGTTPKAKDCLLTVFEFPSKNDTINIVVIILHSDDRFEDTIKLYNWIKDNLKIKYP